MTSCISQWWVDEAERGVKGIVCEKPMAMPLEVADRMLTACRLSGTQLTIGHQRCCYTPQYDSDGNSSHRARLATVRSAESYLLPSCIHTDSTHTIHMLLSLLINPRVSHLLAQVDGHSGHVYYGHVWRLQVLRSSPLNKVFMPTSTGVSFPSTENIVAPITGFSLSRSYHSWRDRKD